MNIRPSLRIANQQRWLRLLAVAWVSLSVTAVEAEGHRGASGDVRWWRDLRSAAAAARRHKKPLFVEISASWCGYCRRLKAETLRDRSVVAHLQKCFVPVEIDADRQAALVEAVGVEGLPTMLIVDPDMNVVRRITGFRSAAQLDATLAEFCRHVRGTPAGPPVPATAGDSRPSVASATEARRDVSSTRHDARSGPAVAAADHRTTTVARSADAAKANAPLAFEGYCLVSMLEEEVLRRGRAEFGVIHRGRTLWFHSLEARRRFMSDPDRYWPVADGADIVAYVDRGERRATDPHLTLVYRGRLWFFADRTAQAAFLAEPDRYVQATVGPARR